MKKNMGKLIIVLGIIFSIFLFMSGSKLNKEVGMVNRVLTVGAYVLGGATVSISINVGTKLIKASPNMNEICSK